MRSRKCHVGVMAALAILTVALLAAGTRAVAQQENVLHNFDSNGTDGAYPYGTLIFDAAGNLYGTTYAGGANGLGILFELVPGGSEQVLYTFSFNTGAYPYDGLIFDVAGNLYGTTYDFGGGAVCHSEVGCGSVFELTPEGG